MTLGSRSIWLLTALIAAYPAASSAQPANAGRPRVELAVGFSMLGPDDVNVAPACERLSLPCGSPRTFPDFGLNAAGGVAVGRGVVLVGEASVYGNAWRTASGPEGRMTNHVRAVLGGVRFETAWIAAGRTNRVRLFAQLLGGPEWSSVISRHMAVQPGGGIDVAAEGRVIVRAQVDYRRAPHVVRDLSTIRATLSVVFAK